MRTYDFSPLYRASVGFDRLAQFLDEASRTGGTGSYPPFNVEVVDDDHYRISMAVAGFESDDLDIQVERDTLKISGKHKEQGEEPNYLHRGIASRDFEQVFRLAEHVRVDGAKLVNGMLTVELSVEVPEALKPRKIEISGGQGSRLIDGAAA